jgi:hypothetical protein
MHGELQRIKGKLFRLSVRRARDNVPNRLRPVEVIHLRVQEFGTTENLETAEEKKINKRL